MGQEKAQNLQKPCTNPECKNGKIIVTGEPANCQDCEGTGVINKTEEELTREEK